MKIVLSGLVAFALLALAAPTVQTAEKSKDTKTPKAGEAFSGHGTVIKNNVDICWLPACAGPYTVKMAKT